MANAVTVSFDDLQQRAEFDLETRFDREYIEVKIDDAVALIDDECPTVPSRLASGALSPNNYKRVVFDVVMRVLRNPGGVASEAEGGYSYSTSATVASGDFWLTDRDLRTLNGATLAGYPGVVSIGVDYGWSR